MIFDEPEAGIDLWSFAKLTETFQAIHARRESTLVVISHQERIINLADEIVLIEDGRVARHGPKEEIFPSILERTSAGCTYLSARRRITNDGQDRLEAPQGDRGPGKGPSGRVQHPLERTDGLPLHHR